MLLWYFEWLAFWENWKQKSRYNVFMRVAFACRYGHAGGYAEAMNIPIRDLMDFNECVASLMEQETVDTNT